MLPPPGEAWRVEVERERSIAGEVFFKNGHMDFDWRSTASMAGGLDRSAVRGMGFWRYIFEGGGGCGIVREKKWAMGVLCRRHFPRKYGDAGGGLSASYLRTGAKVSEA
jgi:hypothetical protein